MYEKKPKICVEAGELADQYKQVFKQEPVIELQQKPAPGTQSRGSTSGGHPGKGGSSKLERVCSRKGLGWKESSALAVRSLDTSRRTAQIRI